MENTSSISPFDVDPKSGHESADIGPADEMPAISGNRPYAKFWLQIELALDITTVRFSRAVSIGAFAV